MRLPKPVRQFQVIPAAEALPADAHDDLRQFFAYWQSKAAAGALPRRRAIDPMEIVRLLPRVFLLDVEAADFRFSLVGQDIADRYGHLKGKSLGELMAGRELEMTLAEHRRCVTSRLPVFSENTMQSVSLGDQQIYQRLLTPYTCDGVAVTCLAGIMVFRSYSE